ncbi:MAG: UPF0182 family protein [Okeania sp. SIO2C9]|uniref:UPF0182 family protein n=1 Tax=Okeania sp. SIO2C9 TaxID=2607791 RepID=UPI0013BEE5B2|nr:UPF0182 family protein [Okeania sp. SIO2C9]NEQ78175.1 UPF0182 family protein [Okeania sp. SIO2C9]
MKLNIIYKLKLRFSKALEQLNFLQILIIFIILLGLWAAFDLSTNILAEFLWFEELNYLPVLITKLQTETSLWIITFVITSVFFLANLRVASIFKYQKNHNRKTEVYEEMMLIPPVTMPSSKLRIEPSFNLGGLLCLVLGLILLIGLILTHYIQVFTDYWHPDFTVAKVSPQIPSALSIESIWQIFSKIPSNWWLLGLFIVLGIIVIINPVLWLSIFAIVLSLIFSFILSNHWGNILQLFNATPFAEREDLFHINISFYVFQIPVLQLLKFWLVGLFLYGLVACTLIYLLSGNSLSKGNFYQFSQQQQRHLHALGGGFILTIAYSYFLGCFELLYSPRGVIYGAGYTDVKIQLPAYIFLAVLALLIALFLFWQAIFSIKDIQPYIEASLRFLRLSRRRKKKKKLSAKLFADSYSLRAILTWYLTIAVLTGWLLPKIVQITIVQPNEIERESPYIKRSIKFTREAYFDPEKLEVKLFNPENKLTYTDLINNKLTIENIRLWDTRPILQTNRQLQEIRPYYEFKNADIDRYTFLKKKEERTKNNPTEKQQVIIAARELNYESVPQPAQTWVNEHLVYTHGYGFTLSPVNQVEESGLPEYFVKNIGPDPTIEKNSTLEVLERIRFSIPIGKPRIYYGELTNTHVITSTAEKDRELDYPSGETNTYNTYGGSGGIVIGRSWKRWIFAKYLKNWRMLLTNKFIPQTKVLYRRNINARVRAIAPFLRYDQDPYLVVANPQFGKQDVTQTTPSYLYWIFDAYTTTDHYPYSDPENNEFNYIRNSVKVVIDAYNGSVKFYVADPKDPIIKTWKKIFPNMFSPIAEMPKSLYTHIRYPVDLFKVQSELLATYHMDNPRVFYNREDLWRVPIEIYGNQQQKVEPYYLITKLPAETSEEFILFLPYTPASRNNLIAWLAARSDAPNYGKLLLYQFPKQRLIYGPEQIEALINQDPEISQQISLWDRQGSKAIQGNLLVIPMNQSLLYVEPIYLEADQNSLPTLARVIVSYENRIVMKPTLDEALREVFEVEPLEQPVVVPSLE